MQTSLILTCEHAGNNIPDAYGHLFKGQEEVLYSHKALDFGALRLALALKQTLGLPLFYTTVSRLLVEANRSLGTDDLFSKYSNILSAEEKAEVLEKFYFPHRNQVEDYIRDELKAGHKVIQVAVHSFTPVLEKEIREADIGILFDPEKPLEVKFAQAFTHTLNIKNPTLKIRDNSPYPGVDDGFPTYLRQHLPSETYAGLELEVNQKFFLAGEPDIWDTLVQDLTKTFSELTGRSF